MIIDVHAHATAPDEVYAFNYRLMGSQSRFRRGGAGPEISDERILAVMQDHIRQVRAVGTDLQLISPRPWAFSTSHRDESAVRIMAQVANDVIARTVKLFPDMFRGVAALPQCAGISPKNCVEELERSVNELGFVGCKINPDAGEGDGQTPPMGEEWWYPLYGKMVELDVPGLLHTGGQRFAREPEAGYFLTEETIAAHAILNSRVFKDFPSLKLIVAHGGAYLPYQVGRQRAPRFNAIRRDSELESFDQSLRRLHYDTVLYNQESLEMLFKLAGPEQCLFGSDRPATGSAVDPETGKSLDDIKPIIESIAWLSDVERRSIFEGNALRLHPRLTVSAAG